MARQPGNYTPRSATASMAARINGGVVSVAQTMNQLTLEPGKVFPYPDASGGSTGLLSFLGLSMYPNPNRATFIFQFRTGLTISSRIAPTASQTAANQLFCRSNHRQFSTSTPEIEGVCRYEAEAPCIFRYDTGYGHRAEGDC